MTTRGRQPGDEMFGDDDEEVAEVKQVYQKGSITQDILPKLALMIDMTLEDPAKRALLKSFLSWLPPAGLEGFLVLALEYGAEKTMREMRRGKLRGRGSAAPA